MYNLIFIALVLVSTGCNTAGLDMYQQPESLTGESTWKGDLYFLKQELPKKHADVYHTLDQEAFELKLEELENYCNEQTQNSKIYFGVKKFIAAIGDAHTSYTIPMKTAYPLNLIVLEDGVFVTAAGGTGLDEQQQEYNLHQLVRNVSQSEPAKAKLIAISNIPIFSEDSNSVFKALLPAISHENEAYARNQLSTYLLDPVMLEGAGIIDETQTCVMTFEFPDATTKSITLEPVDLQTVFKNLEWKVWFSDFYKDSSGIPQGTYTEDREEAYPDYMEHASDFYWARYDKEHALLYILFNTCTQNEEEHFGSFISRILLEYVDGPVEKVVVDLRNNGGGNSLVINPLYGALRVSPVLKQAKKYVITGPRTFSSALMNAIHLYKEFDALVVGLPTGGKPNHYGEVGKIQLPSGNILSWSKRYFRELPGDNSPAFFPDDSSLPAPLNSQDFFHGIDPALTAILDL